MRLELPQEVKLLDLHGRLWPTTVHLAERAGDFGGSPSIHEQSVSVSPRPHQCPVQSNESILPRPKSSISE